MEHGYTLNFKIVALPHRAENIRNLNLGHSGGSRKVEIFL